VSDELIIRFAAPTLASLKVGSLISYRTTDFDGLQQSVIRWNTRLNPKGVKVTILQQKNDLFLLYVHRPKLLEQQLNRLEVQSLLCPLGYPSCPLAESLGHLKHRLNKELQFPHEIGVFLGYPTADVEAFIRHKGCGGKCDGLWKVYTDVEQAQKIFAQFKKCTRLYVELHKRGKQLEDLTVRRMKI
jgi:hypothetical protein